MNIVYGSTINWKYIPEPTNTTSYVSCGVNVNSVVLINPTISSTATIKGYDINGNNTYSKVISNILTNTIIQLGETRTEKTWGIVLDSSSDVISGIYPGSFVTISNPTYPISFEIGYSSIDTETNGGAIYSKLKYSKRTGKFNFTNIYDLDISTLRTIYANTNGFRAYFIIQHPLTNSIFVACSIDTSFPFVQNNVELWSGTMNMSEAPSV